MPLNKQNTRTFHRTLYGTILESVTLLKRGPDQQQGTVTAYGLHQCRWSRIYKTGQPLQGDMSSNHRRTLHIPVIELDRIGITYISAVDRFVDQDGRFWQPESYNTITVKLIENHMCVDCVRIDPPTSGS